MRFRATIELNGKTATGICVPDDVVEALGDSKRPAVTVKIKDYTYRTTVARMGGRFMLPLSGEHRAAAGVQAGDVVDVGIELDSEPRVVDIPDDFAKALDADAAVRKAFDKLPFSHRKEWVRSIEDAKKPETRVRRIEKAITALRG